MRDSNPRGREPNPLSNPATGSFADASGRLHRLDWRARRTCTNAAERWQRRCKKLIENMRLANCHPRLAPKTAP